jgi:hypothetical protein
MKEKECVRPKLYLETTIFNFYYYGKEQKKQRDTRRLFDYIAEGRYLAYTSDCALREMREDTEEKYEKMSTLITKYGIIQLPISDEMERIADRYIARRIIPENYPDDALHLAVATVGDLDFVVSWNMGHIYKQKTMVGVGFVNKREGYHQIGITTPAEVLEYD